jgi:flavin-dependent dehydrogenase
MTYDIAIIGAGLAGLQCARLLGTRGLRVVLIDRKASVSSPVQTTGIFVRKTWEDFPLPEEQLGPPIRDVVLYSPAFRTLALRAKRDEFRVGRMAWLYLYLLEQCTRAGVEWMPDTRVLGIDDHCVLTSRGHVGARFIVGADGARSSIAPQLGLDRNREMLLGLEEIVPPVSRERVLHCFLDPKLAPGYIGWLANDGEEAHLGVAGYRDGWDPARALQALRRTLPFSVGKPIERRGGWIPVNGILRNISNERGLLIGDAAGAVSPLTAGGLDGAMRLSAFAAEVIASYFDSGDARVLRQYSGAPFQARFIARRWMRRAIRAMQSRPLTELAVAMLRTPPLRALAEHVFFARGSFPDVSVARDRASHPAAAPAPSA